VLRELRDFRAEAAGRRGPPAWEAYEARSTKHTIIRIRQGPTDQPRWDYRHRAQWPSSTAKTASLDRNLLQEKRVRQDAW